MQVLALYVFIKIKFKWALDDGRFNLGKCALTDADRLIILLFNNKPYDNNILCILYINYTKTTTTPPTLGLSVEQN